MTDVRPAIKPRNCKRRTRVEIERQEAEDAEVKAAAKRAVKNSAKAVLEARKVSEWRKSAPASLHSATVTIGQRKEEAAERAIEARRQRMERRIASDNEKLTQSPINAAIEEPLEVEVVLPECTLPSRAERPEWYEPVALLGGQTVAKVLELAADPTGSGADMARALNIAPLAWARWLVTAEKETVGLIRDLQRVALADKAIVQLAALLDDPDPYVRVASTKLAAVDLDPERRAGCMKPKDVASKSVAPLALQINFGREIEGV